MVSKIELWNVHNNSQWWISHAHVAMNTHPNSKMHLSQCNIIKIARLTASLSNIRGRINSYLAGMKYVGWRARVFFFGAASAAIYGIFQSSSFRMCLWVVHFKSYFLEFIIEKNLTCLDTLHIRKNRNKLPKTNLPRVFQADIYWEYPSWITCEDHPQADSRREFSFPMLFFG